MSLSMLLYDAVDPAIRVKVLKSNHFLTDLAHKSCVSKVSGAYMKRDDRPIG